MRRSLTTIIGLGIVTAIFMAVMSVFYLQQIPTQADMDQLEEDLRREHGLYLSASAAIKISLVRPKKEGERTGVAVECTMRHDIRRRPGAIEVYLSRIADSVLSHPKWQGKIAFATVSHSPPEKTTLTRFATAPETTAKKPVKPVKKP